MVNKKHIVYLGCSGFPYGLAEIQKIILISKSLVGTGNAVTVICRKGMHNALQHPELKETGNYQGIDFVYTSGTPFHSSSFFVRNLLKVKSVINEFLLLRKMKKNNQLDYAILSTNFYFPVLYYVFLSKIFGFKTILNYVEYYSEIKKKWFQFSLRLNDVLYDKYAPRHVDSVFLISEFLIDHLKKIAPQKKYLKIPNLTDVERFSGIETVNGQEYFLFCGAANYDEIIKFIIDSFVKLNNNSKFLYLVINGSDNDIQGVKNYIDSSSGKDRIRFLSRLTDEELSSYYKNASALLIPLRPTFQDMARFPHKIGEYLASGNPVISTNYGEVKFYFKDKENMLLADSYDINSFSDKMQYVVNNPAEAKRIGEKGKSIAFNNFDFRAMAGTIDNFLN